MKKIFYLLICLRFFALSWFACLLTYFFKLLYSPVCSCCCIFFSHSLLCFFCRIASVQFMPVGSTVRIPCEGYENRTSIKWLYKRDDMDFQTIVLIRKGILLKQPELWPRKRILEGFSLEISPFTELDGGIYVCQTCMSTQMCSGKREISLFPVPPRHGE